MKITDVICGRPLNTDTRESRRRCTAIWREIFMKGFQPRRRVEIRILRPLRLQQSEPELRPFHTYVISRPFSSYRSAIDDGGDESAVSVQKWRHL